jgi:uncharacterized protein
MLSKITQHVFTIPVTDRVMVYNPLNGRYALLSKEGVKLLNEKLIDPEKKSVPGDIKDLADFITATGVSHPEKTGSTDPQFLGIIPSRKCNMACVYCDFGAHQNPQDKLDACLMITAIDWFAEHRLKHKQKTLPIQFFGGEPFVEQELMDIAVHHARFLGSRTGLIPRFEALSNGYYTESQQLFVKDYFDHIIISMDGFRKFHDVTRALRKNKSSFNKVAETLHYLSGQSLNLSIRCCITSESVSEMEAIAEWFCNEFNPDKVNFEALTENSMTKNAGINPPDPFLFAIHTVRSWKILRQHGVEPAYAPVSLNKPQTTSCPVGRDVVIIHPDGMLSSCYLQKDEWISKEMDLSVGMVRDKSVLLDEKKLIILRNQLGNKYRCLNCFCRFGCSGGCHVNNTYPGSSADYEDYCIHTRIITLCSLLNEMGEDDLIDELLNNSLSLEKLAMQKSDKITDFNN